MHDHSITPCYYCGMPATTIDHVIPRVILKYYIVTDKHRVMEVDSCRECNSLLGDHYFDTIEDRKQWLKERLRKRYKGVLDMPQWSPKELSELAPSLASYIRHSLTIRREILARLAF